MKRYRALAVIALACSLGALVVSLSGVAVTGPEQSFAIPSGGSRTSYIRVWNEGSSTATITVTASGAIGDWVSVSPPSFQLGSGQSRKVDLIYNVPSGYQTGSYQGTIEARTTDGSMSTSIQRPVSIWVSGSGGSGTTTISLSSGLNLVSWVGVDTPLDQALGTGQGIDRVWKRSSSNNYIFACYYEGTGWWCADEGFTQLKWGEAYFIECSSPRELVMPLSQGPGTLNLDEGTNLVGWTGQTVPVSVAFPQSSLNHPVAKIWRRNPSGDYTSTQYFPSEDSWWSSDSSFTSLENGRAYFIECTEPASFPIPG
jgi:hypothetical protein